MGAPNAAASITQQLAAMPGKLPPLKVRCEKAPASNKDDKLTRCEKHQICAKCQELNRIAKRRPLKRNWTEQRREEGNNAAKTFKRRLGMRLRGFGPFGRKLAKPAKPEDLRKLFAHDCAYQAWKAGRPPPSPGPNKKANPEMPGLSADHVHEIQLGGSPTAQRNLRMMSSRANSWIGSTLRGYHPKKHRGLKPDCCR